MNRIWTLLMLAGIFAMTLINPSAALPSMLEGGKEAVNLCIRLLAVYSIWCGILSIAEKTGVTDKLSKLLLPVIRKLFGKEVTPETAKYISVNLSANLLGVGGAATPMGLKAMEGMNDNSGVATTGMIMLTVINATGIQLLPTTIIGMRAAAGSAAASDIILPCIIVTLSGTILGILLVKLCVFIENKIKKRFPAKSAAKETKNPPKFTGSATPGRKSL